MEKRKLANESWLLKDGNKKRRNGYMDSDKWKLVVKMKKLVYGNRLLEKGKQEKSKQGKGLKGNG